MFLSTPVPSGNYYLVYNIFDFGGYNIMNKNSLKKNPGVKLMLFGMINFFAFFLASLAGSLIINFIGLSLSLIIAGILVIVLYIMISRFLLMNLLKKGSLTFSGKSKSGVSIYKIDDQIANAMAVGFSKSLGYIIISSGLIKILNEEESAEIINHEDNHIYQMHNLSLMMPGILLVIVMLAVVEITLSSPLTLMLTYAIIMSIGLVLSLTFNRNIETLADITSNSNTLHNALMKIEDHNKGLKKSKNRRLRSRSSFFSTHPPANERPKKPSEVKPISVVGAYISFLVIIGLGIRILLTSEFSSLLVILIISLIISVTLLGAGFIIIEYLFVYNLMGLLSKKFGVKHFETFNALNGTIALFIVSAIPIITNVTDLTIIYVFIISSFVLAIIITALGTKSFKRGIFASILTWIVNSIILLTAVFILTQISLISV